VIRQGVVVAGGGLVVGVVAALGLTRFMQSLLLEVSPTDTGVFVGTIVTLALIVLLACAIPTRRALAVDPAISLRTE
jgi:ABC-type antimicrobial peptide transport system permease subunit